MPPGRTPATAADCLARPDGTTGWVHWNWPACDGRGTWRRDDAPPWRALFWLWSFFGWPLEHLSWELGTETPSGNYVSKPDCSTGSIWPQRRNPRESPSNRL